MEKEINYLEFSGNIGIFYKDELEESSVYMVYFIPSTHTSLNDVVAHSKFLLPDDNVKIKGKLTPEVISKIYRFFINGEPEVRDTSGYGKLHNIGLIKWLRIHYFSGVLGNHLISEDLLIHEKDTIS